MTFVVHILLREMALNGKGYFIIIIIININSRHLRMGMLSQYGVLSGAKTVLSLR